MPSFMTSDLSYTGPQLQQMGDSGGYDPADMGSINLANAGRYGHFSNLAGSAIGNTNYEIGGITRGGPDPFAGDTFGLQMKSGDKQGTYVTYKKQGDRWVPQVETAGTREWNTNPTARDYAPLAIVGGFGLGSALAGGALGAGAGAGAGTGAGAGGSFGLVDTGALAGAGGAAGGAGGSMVPSFLQNLGVSDILKYGSTALKGLNAMNGGTQQMAGGAQPRNWLDQLAGVGTGIYSDNQNRKAFEMLNNAFSRQEEARAPFLNRLQESYTNPNSYLQSPEYQALAGLEQNRLNRGAGATGRLANDIDRETLLQAHAQKNLGNYRQGLQSSMNAVPLPWGQFSEAAGRTARGGGATAGGVNYSGILQNLGGASGISDLLGGAGSFINGISDWFGDSNSFNWDDTNDFFDSVDSWFA
jgi:hypothetical protein